MLGAGLDFLMPGAGLTKKLYEAINGQEKTPLAELSLESRRQEIRMSMLREQARVAQELSIARRIDLAEQVEIEEFYDNSAEGFLGVEVTGEAATLGASGSGRRVTKRIYKFNGFREDIVSYIEDERQKDAEQGNSEHKSSSRDFVMK
ncbi:hypothetical protein [Comamonas jiangduensis]|jgi:hypothetical protein|uniref:hypothetical protein n=1 Tax=Comamonas jiangduensis TaxID=1194168 RepID=UPI003BF8D2EC